MSAIICYLVQSFFLSICTSLLSFIVSTWSFLDKTSALVFVFLSYIKSTYPENIFWWWYSLSTSNLKSLPSMAVIFLATCPHSGNITIWRFYLLWWRYSYPTWSSMTELYSYQCSITETSTQGNRGYTTEILNISYSIFLYIRLVVTL